MWFVFGIAMSCCLFFVVSPESVYAYLDLGAGSHVFQVSLATLLLAPFLAKLYWKELINFLHRIVQRISSNRSHEVNEQDS